MKEFYVDLASFVIKAETEDEAYKKANEMLDRICNGEWTPEDCTIEITNVEEV